MDNMSRSGIHGRDQRACTGGFSNMLPQCTGGIQDHRRLASTHVLAGFKGDQEVSANVNTGAIQAFRGQVDY